MTWVLVGYQVGNIGRDGMVIDWVRLEIGLGHALCRQSIQNIISSMSNQWLVGKTSHFL